MKNNKKAVCIFYEGETEDVFYKKVFEKYLRGVPKKPKPKNLHTGCNINSQVANNLYHFLKEKSNSEIDLYVYAFIDREGPRSSDPQLDEKAILKALKNTDLSGKVIKNIKIIKSVEAIKMVESWFFYDIEGICKYLKIKCTNSIKSNYSNVEKYDSKDLSQLFKRNKKYYKKGEPGFLSCLDIDKIFNSCKDLKDAINEIRQIFLE